MEKKKKNTMAGDFFFKQWMVYIKWTDFYRRIINQEKVVYTDQYKYRLFNILIRFL